MMVALWVGMAKFGISAAFCMVFVCFMELIPTMFTATVFGYGNTAARIVTVLAPQVAEIRGIFPHVLTSTLMVIGAICTFFIITKMPRFV